MMIDSKRITEITHAESCSWQDFLFTAPKK